MSLGKFKYIFELYKYARKAETRLILPLAISLTKQRRRESYISRFAKVSRCGIISPLLLASDFYFEIGGVTRMDADLPNNLGVLSPPEKVRGMKKLDRTMFKKTILVPTLKVSKENIHLIVKNKVLSKLLLKFRGIPNVVNPVDGNEGDAEKKIFLLNPNVFTKPSDVDSSILSEFEKAGCSLQSWETMAVTLSYENWTHRDILKAILPSDGQGVSGFSQIGHIIHLNLKSEILDYKGIIGEILLDKVKTARTVVNKTGIIENTYRNFQMEVIAGDEDFVTTTLECGATYRLDFSKVYWNPRLGFEHERIIEMLHGGDIVFDMFAGIGPFTIPAAKKRCVVYANDLNPDSYKWLNENVKKNKIKEPVHTYNLDGRDFARNVIAKELPKFSQSEHRDKTVHIIMNLPAIAMEFVDVFPGLLKSYNLGKNSEHLPVKVYCHCFSKEKEPHDEIRTRLEERMGRENVPEFEAKYVRNVAPGKEMYRVMFTLDWTLLTCSSNTEECEGQQSRGEGDNNLEPPDKKLKTESNS